MILESADPKIKRDCVSEISTTYNELQWKKLFVNKKFATVWELYTIIYIQLQKKKVLTNNQLFKDYLLGWLN